MTENTEGQKYIQVPNVSGKIDGRNVHQEQENKSLRNQQLAQEVFQPQSVGKWSRKLGKTSLHVFLVLVLLPETYTVGDCQKLDSFLGTFVLIQYNNFYILI